MADKEALFYQTHSQKRVKCLLCPHECEISDGKSGICGARRNVSGKLVTINYGKVSAISMDPIEKKPLYHFFPGKPILSLGTVGCNLKCPFCQNYHISRYYDSGDSGGLETLTPQTAVEQTLRSGSFGIAYTYSEPNVWFEFVLETARLARENGLKNVMVTNGFINPDPLNELIPFIDAANIDIKAFTESHYRQLGAKLSPVLEAVKLYYQAGVHIELTTLLVSDFNDKTDELIQLVDWIADLDKNIPYHLSRYFPHYQYHSKATDVDFLADAEAIARRKLNYVYLGNVINDVNTECPQCGNLLIQRRGYHTEVKGLIETDGIFYCSECGRKSDILMK